MLVIVYEVSTLTHYYKYETKHHLKKYDFIFEKVKINAALSI